MKIYQAISNIMAEVPSIGKNRKNTQQGYTFRGIDDMYNALNDILAKHKVFATSEVLHHEREERQTKSGTNLIYSILTVKFNFYTEDGSNVSMTMIGEGMDSGDKASNKAMSTAYKYAMMQLFCIPTDDLKDTENDSYDVMPSKVGTSSQPSRDRALETKYGSETTSNELPWLNAVGKNGNFTATGNKIIQRFLDDSTMDWVKVAEHYRISKEDRKAIDNAVAEAKLVSSAIPSEVEL
jgi:hypothetical protein